MRVIVILNNFYTFNNIIKGSWTHSHECSVLVHGTANTQYVWCMISSGQWCLAAHHTEDEWLVLGPVLYYPL